jgi:hypothetical protein
MNIDQVLSALQHLLVVYKDGLTITEIQIKLFHEFKLQLSYKTIEGTIFRYPGLFVDSDGKWKLRGS